MMAFTLPCPFSAPEGKGSFFRLYIPPSFRAEVHLLQFTCSAFKGTTSISYHSSVQMIQIELLSCARCGPKLQQHADFSLKSKWHLTCPSAAVQSFSCVQLFVTPWTAACQASLSFTISQRLLKVMSIESVMPMSIESVMPPNHLILCHPLLLPPSILPSIRVFSNESTLLIRWPKYWSFSFSINSSSEYSGLISFRVDWLDLLAVQGTLKSLLQHHSSKASILQHSAFFVAQFSHPYMTTGKTIALTRWTFVGKVMALLFNMLSRLVTAFLPRSSAF